MVFFFQPRGAEQSKHVIYVGRDKVENEELIAHGWPCDIWWHVDGMSSAHVYLRLRPGETLADMRKDEVEDCCQLVKANSIQGCKASSVTVCYTPWANLRKSAAMEVGAVSFHSEKDVLRAHVPSKLSEVLNRLQKTRTERFPNHAREKEEMESEIRAAKREADRARRKEEQAIERERMQQASERSYDRLQDSEKMRTNAALGQAYASVEDAEADFM
jgi:Skp family chaperone for outer membrane proteins